MRLPMRWKFWVLLVLPMFEIGSLFGEIPCPDMPDKITQVNHDVRSDIQAQVGGLGKLKAGQLGIQTDVVAKNLFDKYPNTDRIIVVQMMAATYCPMVRDDKTLKDSEKRRLWTEFSDRVFKFTNPSYKPSAAPPLKAQSSVPKDAAKPDSKCGTENCNLTFRPCPYSECGRR
jgi:hypothetical protein